MDITRPLKLYLDTSIINFAVSMQDIAKEKRVTLCLLTQLQKNKFMGYISEIVLREIQKASEPKQKDLLGVIDGLPLNNLVVSDEVDALADKYIQQGIIPERYRDDALHIAIASINHIDVIVSWNFEHLVKVKTRREVQGINRMLGYPSIDIATPEEVIEDEGTETNA